MNSNDIIVIGGGAAGFFAAINAAQMQPHLRISILERGKKVLTKVKVSGGGRCNVTHAEFLPKELSQNYPRGEKELLGPFHTFMTGDTIEWFEKRGVLLKTEDDGRMFPDTDSSQTIIDCFLYEAKKHGVSVLLSQPVREIEKTKDSWKVSTTSEEFTAKTLIIATGSNPKVWRLLERLGHSVIAPVASLFTFNIDDVRISELSGISTSATVRVLNDNGSEVLRSEGPLLITHWGMSGPAILRLSAWGARILEPLKYHFKIKVNWLIDVDNNEGETMLKDLKMHFGRKAVYKNPQFQLPKRLWQSIVMASGISEDTIWADITKIQLENLALQLTSAVFEVTGKSTFKEEFVTAGGIELKEVNFKTFESKLHRNLYFAGEVLNIDAITGGFNFQNAWTGGYMVAQAITKNN